MNRMSVEALGTGSAGSVLAMRRFFEACHRSEPSPSRPCHRTSTPSGKNITGESKILKGMLLESDRRSPKLSGRDEAERTVSQRCASPNACSPSRSKPNTYQSSVASEFRKKYQQLPHSELQEEHPVPQTNLPDVPLKPPRTFAHDVYVQEKEQIKVLVDQKYRRRGAEKGLRTRRRLSRSAEPVGMPRRVPPIPYCNITDLFDQPSPVKSIIRESFGRADERPSLIDSLSSNDVEQDVSYAKTLRITLRGKSISHYSSVADISTREACLCNFVTIYDKQTDAVTIHPVPSDTRKADFVKKFSQSCEDSTDQFCWFAFTEHNFFYTYFLSQENRVLSLSSQLYSPHFFSILLKAIAPGSQVLDKDVVDELVAKKIPLPGEVISLRGSDVEVPWELPQVTATKPSILLTYMEPEAIVKSVATLVQEKRLAFVSGNADLLVEASKALLALMYPLVWDYMFWPFVPHDLVKLCAALTLPYFICLRRDQLVPFLEALRKRSHKILVVDLDARGIVQETGCEHKILPKVYSRSVLHALNLSRNMTDPTDCVRDKVMEEAWLEVFTQLLGPVTLFVSDGSFSKETFIKSLHSRDNRSFFDWFSETRLFENFVKYWQVRTIHSKYIPISKKLVHMDLFERKTEFLRQQQNISAASRPKPKEKSGTIGWSGTAIQVVEKRFTAIGNKLKKHI